LAEPERAFSLMNNMATDGKKFVVTCEYILLHDAEGFRINFNGLGCNTIKSWLRQGHPDDNKIRKTVKP
jgi:hypothetical protein